MSTTRLIFLFVVFAAFIVPGIVLLSADDTKAVPALAPPAIIHPIDKANGEHFRRMEFEAKDIDNQVKDLAARKDALIREYADLQAEMCKAASAEAKFAPTDKSNCTVDTNKRKDADYGVVMLVKTPPEEKKAEGK